MKNFAAEIKALHDRQIYRQINTYQMIDACHACDENKVYLMLASNNYLGLTHHSKVKTAAINAVTAYGTGSGGSRLTTGANKLQKELETKLAKFKGTEASLLFNTGYMANVGIISAVMGLNDVIFSDELNHASIVDGCRLSKSRVIIYRHNDMSHLAELLAAVPCRGQRLIVTDGVFSMDGDIAPLPDIVQLAEQYEAMTMIDDAHAVGVLGPNGQGTAAYYGLEPKVTIQMGTLSKALACEGGYAAGSRQVIDYLINKARSFIFSTALAPATAGAGLAALEELQNHPNLVMQLNENAKYLRNQLIAAGLPVINSQTPIIPVLTGDEQTALKMMHKLKGDGIIISAIRPPTVPVGTSRLRITVSAAHDVQELAWAARMIKQAARSLGLGEE